MRCVVHHEKGSFPVPAEVDDAHDMGMRQARDGARLGEKTLHVLGCQLGVQHLDGDPRLQVDMLTQVDLGEAALVKQAQDMIVAQLLSCAICHLCISLPVLIVFIVRFIVERWNGYVKEKNSIDMFVQTEEGEDEASH